jgi:hypothetical protein
MEIVVDYLEKAIIGSKILRDTSLDATLLILSGDVDMELQCAIYFGETFENTANVSDINSPTVLELLANYKRKLRAIVESEIARFDKEQKAKVEKHIQEKLQERNKPSAFGTVSELAEKLKISKSEVRRLKASGKLEDFVLLNDPNKSQNIK